MRVLVDGDLIQYWAAFAGQTTIRSLLDGYGDTVASFTSAKDRNTYLKERGEKKEQYTEKVTIEPIEETELYNIVDNILFEIIQDLEPSSATLYLGGEGNFRKDLYDDYKANRTTEKPYHYYNVRRYLCNKYNAVVVEGMETDDKLCIEATNHMGDSIIVSEDKDFQQMANTLLYNPKTKKMVTRTEKEASRFLYAQAVEGDRSDNIRGIPGAGKAAAKKALKGTNTEREMYEAVLKLYKKNGMTEDDLFFTLNLVYLLRGDDEYYKVPEQVREESSQEP